jgi:uncharacterized protein (DUF305 family)
MTFRHMALMTFITVFITLSPVLAQDHSQHQQAGHGSMQKAKKDCACCKSGKCPMMKKEGMSSCKSGMCPMMKGDHTSHGMTATTPDARELEAAMTIMHREMAKPYTGDTDADFIRGMIPHHQGAIHMAEIELKYGDDPDARKLARTIIRAQKGEIALMRRWLEYRQVPEHGAYNFNQ